MTKNAIGLRPAQAADDSLQFELYATTRAAEMALVDWTTEQKEAFIRMQFAAQTQSYRSQFPQASRQIITRDGDGIGRLIVDRSGPCILLIDITVLPAHRRAGIGTRLLRELQDEAAATGRPLRLHVETFNPALRLYQRLGFRPVSANGLYLELEWRPAARVAVQPDEATP